MSEQILVDKETFGWLVDYALELKGEWDWKRNSTPRLDAEYKQLCLVSENATMIRDHTPPTSNVEKGMG